MWNSMKKAFPVTLPVLAGYMFLGIAFGVAMKARGLGMGLSISMSVLIYGGSFQFAMIELLIQAFAPLTIAFMACLIQARHLFYGISMLQTYRQAGLYTPYLVFALTDETYSIVCSGAPKETEAFRWYAAVSFLDHCYWVLGTFLGALVGQFLPMHLLEGMDFSMTALFAAIVTEQTLTSLAEWKAGRMSFSEVLFSPALGGCCTLISRIVIGRENFLLMSMMMMTVGFAVYYRKGEHGA